MASVRVRPPSLPSGNFVSTAEAAEAVGLSEITIRKAARSGRIRGVKVGRAVWVDLDSALTELVQPLGAPVDPIEAAAQKIADSWPELTDDQRNRISTLLRPAAAELRGGAA